MASIGLMGCGAVADYGHLPAIAQVDELDLTAVFDIDMARAEAAAAQFGGKPFTDVEQFLTSGIDAVTITSPAPAHLQNVLDATRHGLSILCEKPLAMNEAEARQMIDAADEAGVALYTAFCYRFAPAAMTIKRLVDEGAIGQVRSLRLLYLWDCHGKFEHRDPAMGIQKRRTGRMLEGGPMVDCGTHQIDLATWWLDSPVEQFDGIGAWVDEWEAPDHIWLHMDHACGAHTCVEISYSYGHTAKEPIGRFDYELIGTDGMIRYRRNSQLLELHTARGIEQLQWTPEKDFVGLYREFAQALKTGRPGHLTTAEAGLAVTNIARRATDQAINRRMVRA